MTSPISNCDDSLLGPSDSKEVAAAQRNNLACEAEDETCNRSALSVEEAKQNAVGDKGATLTTQVTDYSELACEAHG